MSVNYENQRINLSELLEELTVIIFSRGREKQLEKSIGYWATLDIRLLVVHNTDKPIEMSYEKQKVEYVVVEDSYAVRCKIASENIQTPFSIICSDDEFFLPSSLESMLKEFQKDKSLVSVGAQSMAISKYGPRISAKFIYRNLLDYRNLSSLPSSRIQKHFYQDNMSFNGAMYRVLRTESMIQLLSLFYRCQSISTPYIFEVTGEIAVTLLGPSKYINEIFWLRNWIEPPINKKNWNRRIYFHNWWEEEIYKVERENWVKNLGNFSLNLITTNEIDNLLGKIYLKRKNSELHEFNSTKKTNVHIPIAVKFFLRKILLPKSLPNSLEQEFLLIKASDVKFDKQEVMNTIRYIIN